MFWFCGKFQGLGDVNGQYLCAVIYEENDNPYFPNFFGILGGKELFQVLFVLQVSTFIFLQCLSYFITNTFELIYA